MFDIMTDAYWQKMNAKQREELDNYCLNDMMELKFLCFQLSKKIGGISEADYYDLYSIGLSVLADSINKYDWGQKKCKFRTYLSGNIRRKYSTYMRDANREMRSSTTTDEDGNKVFIKNKSLDQMNREDVSLSEKIGTVSDAFETIFRSEFDNPKYKEYFSRLSNTQRKILFMLVDKYKPEQIKKELKLSTKQYMANMAAIQAYENTRILM